MKRTLFIASLAALSAVGLVAQQNSRCHNRGPTRCRRLERERRTRAVTCRSRPSCRRFGRLR